MTIARTAQAKRTGVGTCLKRPNREETQCRGDRKMPKDLTGEEMPHAKEKRILTRNERISKSFTNWGLPKDGRTRVFECHGTPDMSIQSYLERIFRYTRAGPSVYVVSYVYIDRFSHLHPKFKITATNVHRFLIATIMLASKYVEDM
ncbi:PREDICTED: cyclin-U2-1-like [Ipomoea nil]|uniref:cyclin-U2-1-like n=1 Tax=Ipomoea nil TaxID=35883 RepID=UPI00090109B2|nr:PREDICTED: cyclin-U2-1-like [Ipomoea nil]